MLNLRMPPSPGWQWYCGNVRLRDGVTVPEAWRNLHLGNMRSDAGSVWTKMRGLQGCPGQGRLRWDHHEGKWGTLGPRGDVSWKELLQELPADPLQPGGNGGDSLCGRWRLCWDYRHDPRV